MNFWKERLWKLATLKNFVGSDFVSVIRCDKESLSSSERAILALRFIAGLSFGEIGSELKISKKTAFMRCRRVIEKLGICAPAQA